MTFSIARLCVKKIKPHTCTRYISKPEAMCKGQCAGDCVNNSVYRGCV